MPKKTTATVTPDRPSDDAEREIGWTCFVGRLVAAPRPKTGTFDDLRVALTDRSAVAIVETSWSPAQFCEFGAGCVADVESFDVVVMDVSAESADVACSALSGYSRLTLRDRETQALRVVLPLRACTYGPDWWQLRVALQRVIGGPYGGIDVLRPSRAFPMPVVRSFDIIDASTVLPHIDAAALIAAHAPEAELPETDCATSFLESVTPDLYEVLGTQGHEAALARLGECARRVGQLVELGELHPGGAEFKLWDAAIACSDDFNETQAFVTTRMREGALEVLQKQEAVRMRAAAAQARDSARD